MAVSDADVNRLLTQSEGQHLEFKGGRSVLKFFRNYLPQTIAGFANAGGGVIIFGTPRTPRANISEYNPLLGLDAVAPVERAVRIATEEVEPRPVVNTSVHDIRGQKYVTVEVGPGHDPPYIGAGAAVTRVGDRLLPLPAERLRKMLTRAGMAAQSEMLDRILTANDRQARLIENLHSEIVRSTSTRRQIAFGIAFAALGALFGTLIALATH
jgi:predicted HTH transcriptional regulator